MLAAILLLLQTATVGQPVPSSLEVRVGEAKRVGQTLTVSYTLTNRGSTPQPVPKASVVDPAGRSLRGGKPTDVTATPPPPAEVAPGATVGDTVTFEVLTDAASRINPRTFNESTWFFIVGGDRIPFRF